MTDVKIENGVLLTDEMSVNVAAASDGQATQELFVSANGNNAGGHTWATAYTTLEAAIDAISSDSDELTLINIAPGSYDINTTGIKTISSNIYLRGPQRNMVEITNTHASATGIFKFTGKFILERLTLDIGATTQTAININGASARGRIERCYIECDTASGAHTGILIDGSTKYIRILNSWIHGTAASTTGIKFAGATYCDCEHLWVKDCLIGVHLDTTADEDNRFFDIQFQDNATAVTIDAGADNNRFSDIHFSGNTTNVTEAATAGTTTYTEIHLAKETESMTPDDSTGVPITSGGLNTYTAVATAIISNIATPYKIVGFVATSMTDVTSVYTLQLLVGGVVIGTYAFYGGTTRTASPKANSGWFSPNTAVTGKIKSSSAGADAANIFLKYVAM